MLAVLRRFALAMLLAIAALAGGPPGRATEGQPLIRVGLALPGPSESATAQSGLLEQAMMRGIDRLADLAGIRVAYEVYPWRRVQQLVRDGGLDAFCTVATAERQGYAVFTSSPLLTSTMAIYHRAEDPRPVAIRSLGEVQSFRLASYLGNGYVEELFGRDQVAWTSTPEGVFRMIEAGHADVMIAEVQTAPVLLREIGLEDRLVGTPAAFLPPVEYRLGLRRSYPEGTAILARLERAIAEAHTDPDFAATILPYQP
jgi:polar amino acid transport system substrate-binding protein